LISVDKFEFPSRGLSTSPNGYPPKGEAALFEEGVRFLDFEPMSPYLALAADQGDN
jgi:hypothetical protein